MPLEEYRTSGGLHARGMPAATVIGRAWERGIMTGSTDDYGRRCIGSPSPGRSPPSARAPATSPDGRGAPGAPERRSPFRYFALLFLITVPAYALRLVPPYSLVMVVLPLVAASLLTWREAGRDGVRHLVGRAADYRRIRQKRWYLPILLTMPAALALQYGWLRLTGAPVTAPGVTAPMLAAYFLVFVAAGAGEEIGWSAYALDPLQRRWGALGAAVVIGSAWALWHIIPYALANPPAWVAGQAAATVLIRVLMVWVYNNTGGSVFGQVLFHAMTNMVTVPDYGFSYDPIAMSAVLAVVAAIVVFLWGPRTLARFGRPRDPGAGLRRAA